MINLGHEPRCLANHERHTFERENNQTRDSHCRTSRRSRTTMKYAGLALAMVSTACGGGTSPTPTTPTNFLAGTWRGSATLTRVGHAPQLVATVWVFRPMD